MTVFVEYAVSQGPGTLIEHCVWSGVKPDGMVAHTANFALGYVLDVDCPDGSRFAGSRITPERYQEFLSIHGSERAV